MSKWRNVNIGYLLARSLARCIKKIAHTASLAHLAHTKGRCWFEVLSISSLIIIKHCRVKVPKDVHRFLKVLNGALLSQIFQIGERRGMLPSNVRRQVSLVWPFLLFF